MNVTLRSTISKFNIWWGIWAEDWTRWSLPTHIILWFMRVSHILTTNKFVYFSSYHSSHLTITETNKIFHVALNPAAGEVLDSLDQALLLPLMETCCLRVTALWTDRSNTVSDRLRKWNNHLHILLYDFFLQENMKVKCGGQVQGDWN